MKTENELNLDILTMTLKIRTLHPELSKYILEMPITIPNKANPEMNKKNLTDYYNSLEELLKSYSPTHNE